MKCLVGLGSNLGDSRSILDRTVQQLKKHFQVVSVSRWYTYPSVGPDAEGNTDQPDFLNGAVVIDSNVSAVETAAVLHELEEEAGRNRTVRWSSRTLDADLLLFGTETVETNDLQVPHPRMMSRKFVLEPACEIAPDLVHPSTGWTIQRTFEHLCAAPPYFAIVGPNQENCTSLATRLAEETSGSLFCLPRPQSGSDSLDAVESVRKEVTKLAKQIRSLTLGPWFSDFWIADFEGLTSSDDFDPAWNPKLVLVTEARSSKFVENLDRKVCKWAHLRVPMICLSRDENEAWQDALGAVQGMCQHTA